MFSFFFVFVSLFYNERLRPNHCFRRLHRRTLSRKNANHKKKNVIANILILRKIALKKTANTTHKANTHTHTHTHTQNKKKHRVWLCVSIYKLGTWGVYGSSIHTLN